MDDNILAFPITRIDGFDFLTEREAVYQLRLEAIKMINRMNAGLYLPTRNNIEALKFIRDKSKQHGLGLLEFDERHCVNVQEIGYLSEE